MTAQPAAQPGTTGGNTSLPGIYAELNGPFSPQQQQQQQRAGPVSNTSAVSAAGAMAASAAASLLAAFGPSEEDIAILAGQPVPQTRHGYPATPAGTSSAVIDSPLSSRTYETGGGVANTARSKILRSLEAPGSAIAPLGSIIPAEAVSGAVSARRRGGGGAAAASSAAVPALNLRGISSPPPSGTSAKARAVGPLATANGLPSAEALLASLQDPTLHTAATASPPAAAAAPQPTASAAAARGRVATAMAGLLSSTEKAVGDLALSRPLDGDVSSGDGGGGDPKATGGSATHGTSAATLRNNSNNASGGASGSSNNSNSTVSSGALPRPVTTLSSRIAALMQLQANMDNNGISKHSSSNSASPSGGRRDSIAELIAPVRARMQAERELDEGKVPSPLRMPPVKLTSLDKAAAAERSGGSRSKNATTPQQQKLDGSCDAQSQSTPPAAAAAAARQLMASVAAALAAEQMDSPQPVNQAKAGTARGPAGAASLTAPAPVVAPASQGATMTSPFSSGGVGDLLAGLLHETQKWNEHKEAQRASSPARGRSRSPAKRAAASSSPSKQQLGSGSPQRSLSRPQQVPSLRTSAAASNKEALVSILGQISDKIQQEKRVQQPQQLQQEPITAVSTATVGTSATDLYTGRGTTARSAVSTPRGAVGTARPASAAASARGTSRFPSPTSRSAKAAPAAASASSEARPPEPDADPFGLRAAESQALAGVEAAATHPAADAVSPQLTSLESLLALPQPQLQGGSLASSSPAPLEQLVPGLNLCPPGHPQRWLAAVATSLRELASDDVTVRQRLREVVQEEADDEVALSGTRADEGVHLSRASGVAAAHALSNNLPASSVRPDRKSSSVTPLQKPGFVAAVSSGGGEGEGAPPGMTSGRFTADALMSAYHSAVAQRNEVRMALGPLIAAADAVVDPSKSSSAPPSPDQIAAALALLPPAVARQWEALIAPLASWSHGGAGPHAPSSPSSPSSADDGSGIDFDALAFGLQTPSSPHVDAALSLADQIARGEQPSSAAADGSVPTGASNVAATNLQSAVDRTHPHLAGNRRVLRSLRKLAERLQHTRDTQQATLTSLHEEARGLQAASAEMKHAVAAASAELAALEAAGGSDGASAPPFQQLTDSERAAITTELKSLAYKAARRAYRDEQEASLQQLKENAEATLSSLREEGEAAVAAMAAQADGSWRAEAADMTSRHAAEMTSVTQAVAQLEERVAYTESLLELKTTTLAAFSQHARSASAQPNSESTRGTGAGSDPSSAGSDSNGSSTSSSPTKRSKRAVSHKEFASFLASCLVEAPYDPQLHALLRAATTGRALGPFPLSPMRGPVALHHHSDVASIASGSASGASSTLSTPRREPQVVSSSATAAAAASVPHVSAERFAAGLTVLTPSARATYERLFGPLHAPQPPQQPSQSQPVAASGALLASQPPPPPPPPPPEQPSQSTSASLEASGTGTPRGGSSNTPDSAVASAAVSASVAAGRAAGRARLLVLQAAAAETSVPFKDGPIQQPVAAASRQQPQQPQPLVARRKGSTEIHSSSIAQSSSVAAAVPLAGKDISVKQRVQSSRSAAPTAPVASAGAPTAPGSAATAGTLVPSSVSSSGRRFPVVVSAPSASHRPASPAAASAAAAPSVSTVVAAPPPPQPLSRTWQEVFGPGETALLSQPVLPPSERRGGGAASVAAAAAAGRTARSSLAASNASVSSAGSSSSSRKGNSGGSPLKAVPLTQPSQARVALSQGRSVVSGPAVIAPPQSAVVVHMRTPQRGGSTSPIPLHHSSGGSSGGSSNNGGRRRARFSPSPVGAVQPPHHSRSSSSDRAGSSSGSNDDEQQLVSALIATIAALEPIARDVTSGDADRQAAAKGLEAALAAAAAAGISLPGLSDVLQGSSGSSGNDSMVGNSSSGRGRTGMPLLQLVGGSAQHPHHHHHHGGHGLGAGFVLTPRDDDDEEARFRDQHYYDYSSGSGGGLAVDVGASGASAVSSSSSTPLSTSRVSTASTATGGISRHSSGRNVRFSPQAVVHHMGTGATQVVTTRSVSPGPPEAGRTQFAPSAQQLAPAGMIATAAGDSDDVALASLSEAADALMTIASAGSSAGSADHETAAALDAVERDQTSGDDPRPSLVAADASVARWSKAAYMDTEASGSPSSVTEGDLEVQRDSAQPAST